MSVLEIEHKQQERPYSQDELQHRRTSFYQRLRLSDVVAHHLNCNQRTPKNLKKVAENLVFCFQEAFGESCDKEYINFDNLSLEQDFYNWLYKEFNN
jgi:hypothetical protein